jgi:hypothetical protein
MHHPRFDLDVWRGRLVNAGDGPNTTPALSELHFDSPVSVVVGEHYRAAAAAEGLDLGSCVPVDRFIFGKGEASKRYLTKINGLPYRPKDRPWPRDRHGSCMTFLMQFCFADSRDIFGELPGDVLVVFARTESGGYVVDRSSGQVVFERTEWGNFMIDPNYDADCLVFEWYPLGLVDLPGPADIPEPRTVFPTCYALRFRSCDYLDDASAAEKLRAIVPSEQLPEIDFVREFTLRGVVRNTRTKIGGLAFWYDKPQLEDDARFLASFGGVQPAFGCPYPWANVVEPLAVEECIKSDNSLIFRDGCNINLFLKGDGSMDWTTEFL